MILYENTIDNFIDSALRKRLVPFILNEYKKIKGEVFPIAKALFKIALDEICLYFNDISINEKCGVRIELLESSIQARLCLIFASKNNDKNYVGIVNVFPYEKVKHSEQEDMIYATDGISDEYELVIHPSYQAVTFERYLSRNLDDSKTEFISIPLLYECMQDKACDINDGIDKEYINIAPVVYYNQRDLFIEKMKDVFENGNGIKALEELKKKEKVFFQSESHELYDEQKYIVNQVYSDLQNNNNVWYFIKTNDNNGKNNVIELCEIEAKKQNKTISIYDENNVVSLQDVNRQGVSLLFYSSYCSEEESKEVCEYALENGINVKSFHFSLSESNLEENKGLAFLAKCFGLETNGLNTDWNPNYFPIKIVDREERFTDEEGYINLVIKDNVSYDSERKCVKGSKNAKQSIMRKLSKAKKGIVLLIEDENLSDYINSSLNLAKERIKSLIEMEEMLSDQVVLPVSKDDSYYDSQLVDDIKKQFGKDAWEKLEDDSKTLLISAFISYEGCREFDQLVDFSGVCLQACKTVEVELAKRYCADFIEYIKKKYKEEAIDKAPYELLQNRTNPKAPKDFINPKNATIGSFRHIMGIAPEGKVVNKYSWNEFQDFAIHELLVDTSNPLKTLSEHISYISNIQFNYRNKSAHKDTMDVTEAYECINYIAGQYRKLGVILDDYKY